MGYAHHIVMHSEINMRVDKLLTHKLQSTSRSQVQTLIKNGFVKVNNKEVKANYRCQLKDEIKWSFPEEKSFTIKPEHISLDIIYEDSHLIVINKPRGMVVHPSRSHQTGTLVNALLSYSNHLSTIGGEERPGIVHRLDKDTSGLIVVAKNNEAHIQLTKQLAKNKMTRIYEAIVHRVIDHKSGTIDAPIGRNPKHRLKQTVISTGQLAITHFKVLQTYENYTYVQCQLETGRTHQIRVHMDYIGHPIVGDQTYSQIKVPYMDSQALFAKELAFKHPNTDEFISFKINKPAYIQNFLTNIDSCS